MIKNKCYIYGEENTLNVPADINYGKHMLKKFIQYNDRIAIIEAFTGKSVTYAEMAQMTVDIALSLSRMGVGKGHVVGICSEECVEYYPTMFGIMCAGATFTAIDVSGDATILHRLKMVQPRIIFCSPRAYKAHKNSLQQPHVKSIIMYGDDKLQASYKFSELLSNNDVRYFEAAPVNGCEDFVAILYSSGTTGLPKGVPMTHMNLLVHMLTKMDATYYTGQVVLIAADYCTFNLSCLHAGATTVFTRTDRVNEIFDAIQKYKVKIVQQMPSTIFEMINSTDLNNYDLSSMKRILSASAPLRAHLALAVKKKFPNIDIFQIYGATEIGVMCSDETAPKGMKPGSIGCAKPGLIIKVLDTETNEPVGANEQGEICVKSQSLFPGYIGDLMYSHMDKEGFYHTGDVGYYDDDQYFFIVDRIKDLIKYHGYPVAPAELEAVLLKHPSVLEGAVVGAPDEQYYELPTAFVVARPGVEPDADDIVQFVNKQVAHWMPLAGGVKFISKMPRGKRAKLDRKALRNLLIDNNI